jgi:hypothetical protein
VGAEGVSKQTGAAVVVQWISVAAAGCLYLLSRQLDNDDLGVLMLLVFPFAFAATVVLVRAVERASSAGFERWAWLYAVVGLMPLGGTAFWVLARRRATGSL